MNVAVDDATVFDQTGESTSVDVSTALTNGVVYSVTLFEPEEVPTGGLPALVGARLTWP
jgi:hypothetical protein